MEPELVTVDVNIFKFYFTILARYFLSVSLYFILAVSGLIQLTRLTTLNYKV